jgi:hypothetical protein
MEIRTENKLRLANAERERERADADVSRIAGEPGSLPPAGPSATPGSTR